MSNKTSVKRVSFSDLLEQPQSDPNDPDQTAAVVSGYHEEQEEEEEQEDEDEESESMASFSDSTLPRPCLPPRVAAASSAAACAAPQSPVRKKLTALQDRRVNTILLEALQLVDFSKDELAVIDKAVKKLRDAIDGFSILVDKQVTIIGAETLAERGRVRADIQDLAENLRVSYEILETTSSKMKHTLISGKQQLQYHKKKAAAAAAGSSAGPSSPKSLSSSPSRANSGRPFSSASSFSSTPWPSVADAGISGHPTIGRVPLLSVLDCQPSVYGQEEGEDQQIPVYMTPEFFHSVMKSVGLDEKEFLDLKDIMRFLQETLTFSIAKSHTLTFMGKAFHRRLIPLYTNEIAQRIIDHLQLPPTTPPTTSSTSSVTSPTFSFSVVPNNTFYDFMCQEPFRFDLLLDQLYVADANQYTGEPSPITPPMAIVPANPFSDHFTRNGGVMHGGKVVTSLLMNRPDPEMLETAEQTLAMAKLLHDLATAESEARHGNRLSFRPQSTRNNEFSQVYLASSKELLSKESGV